jgi:hypothetical protein
MNKSLKIIYSELQHSNLFKQQHQFFINVYTKLTILKRAKKGLAEALLALLLSPSH